MRFKFIFIHLGFDVYDQNFSSLYLLNRKSFKSSFKAKITEIVETPNKKPLIDMNAILLDSRRRQCSHLRYPVSAICPPVPKI